MATIFFKDQNEFRLWLEKNHDKESELFVGYYKVNSGKATMSWSESVDQALCFGWIDSVKYTIDHESYHIRFTPRKQSSIWSAVNIAKIEKLKAQGLMHQSGLNIYNLRTEAKSKIYSFENEEQKLSPEFEKLFKANKKAWHYFQALPPSYRKSSLNWVMSAKQESTCRKRLNELIADSAMETNKWKHNKYNKGSKS
jgi:uncharacterized protein YdeI (YjbR/CyaY-like superfamily)